jgi:hypothetical protein
MQGEPFELKCIKREIDKVRTSSLPVGLTRITIHTSDAIWLVRQVEKLQKIANAWNDFQKKEKDDSNKNIGNLLDVRV